MKSTGVVLLCLLSGVVGGAISSRLAPSFDPLGAGEIRAGVIRAGVIVLQDSDKNGSLETQLTSDGLQMKWKDGQVDLDPHGLMVRTAHHFIKLGLSDMKELNASYLVLDGRVWHAPSTRNKLDLLVNLSATGEINPKMIEDQQPN